MGGIIASLFGWRSQAVTDSASLDPATADIPDRRTGITPRQIHAVRQHWDVVRQDMRGHGVMLFIRLFQAKPETQNLFKQLKGQSEAELKESNRLKAHGTTFMHSLTTMIDNLEDPAVLREICLNMGRRHKTISVPENYFEMIIPVALGYFKEALGSAVTPFSETAWRRVLMAINSIVHEIYSDPRE